MFGGQTAVMVELSENPFLTDAYVMIPICILFPYVQWLTWYDDKSVSHLWFYLFGCHNIINLQAVARSYFVTAGVAPLRVT